MRMHDGIIQEKLELLKQAGFSELAIGIEFLEDESQEGT